MSSEEASSFLPAWVEKARETGTSLGLYAANGTVSRDLDHKLPVIHKFMAKFLEEDNEGEITMVGTIIQQVAGMNKSSESSVDYKVDKFRLNDLTAKIPDQIEERRSVPVPGYGSRTTYNCCIPMAKKPIFTVPPYEILKVTALIELTTSSKETPADGKIVTTNVRPDIYINPKDERELFLIREKAELNNTTNYNLVTEAASVEVTYEQDKQYCPKYKVGFYLETPATYKFIATFMPLVFVVLLAILNVMNGDGEGPNIENSIALCLTVVFILPELRPPGRGDMSSGWISYVFSNNTSIFLLFVGLCCTSITNKKFFDEYRAANPEAAETYIPFFDSDGNGTYGFAETFGMVGIICLVLSLIIPFVNYFRYRIFINKIRKSAYVEGDEGQRLAFAKDDTFNVWEIKNKENKKVGDENAILEDESIIHLNGMCSPSHLKDKNLEHELQVLSDEIKEKMLSSQKSASFSALQYKVDTKTTVWICNDDKPKKGKKGGKGKLGKKILTCGPSHK